MEKIYFFCNYIQGQTNNATFQNWYSELIFFLPVNDPNSLATEG